MPLQGPLQDEVPRSTNALSPPPLPLAKQIGPPAQDRAAHQVDVQGIVDRLAHAHIRQGTAVLGKKAHEHDAYGWNRRNIRFRT
jgi:hypothetical protein